VRLPVKLGVLDPVDERDAVMVLVKVLEADEPAVADRDSAGFPVLVAEGERVAVTVGETVAAARERVRVAVTVGETVAAARERVAVTVGETVAPARERVRVAVTVEETVAPARERVAVAVGVNKAPARERVAVTVAETGPAIRERVPVAEIEPAAAGAREREIVGETVPAGRRRERVPVAEIEPAPAGIRERVAVALAVKLPPAEDGKGVCAHPAETAKAKKNSFLIMFMIITLTPRNLFYNVSYLREDCFHELPHVVH
jgi:hypothetical protein